jgi:hypothetical protein
MLLGGDKKRTIAAVSVLFNLYSKASHFINDALKTRKTINKIAPHLTCFSKSIIFALTID